jgi:hypothetical protein
MPTEELINDADKKIESLAQETKRIRFLVAPLSVNYIIK